MTVIGPTEWEGERTRLVRLVGLPVSDTRRYHQRAEPIREVYIHHSGGSFLAGLNAPSRIAQYHAGVPKYREVNGERVRVGGGRGWPGIGYTFVVPAVPDVQDGRLVVYRCHGDETHSYHTGRGANARGVGIAVAGTYRSRHAPQGRSKPDDTAMVALADLVAYLLPRYGLTVESLRGHFDAGKPACPGDHLEQWVRFRRGEDVPEPGDEVWPRARRGVRAPDTFNTSRTRQKALAEIGFDLGPAGVDGRWGEDSRSALECFQAVAGLPVDGVWGPITEDAVRVALDRVRRSV